MATNQPLRKLRGEEETLASPRVAVDKAAPAAVPEIPRPHASAPVVIAVLLSMAGLWFARSILVPIVIGVLISYALDPLQRRIVRWLPGPLAAAVILSTVIGVCGAAVYALRDQATMFITEIPRVAEGVKRSVTAYRRSGPSAVEQFEYAAKQLKEAAAPTASAAPRGVTRVQIETPAFPLSDLLWQGSLGALELAGQTLLTLFLAYYLLAVGDLYKRKIVRIVGPSLSEKKTSVEILNEIDRQIESFLVTRGIVSAIVGVSTALVFWALGVGQPAIWGVAAGLLNIFPYLGPAMVTLAAGVTGYVQFGTLSMAAAVAGAATAVASFEGFVITPWLMGRAGRMSPAAVFIGVSFWGWIWGIPGLLLAVPILMVAKAICDHVESLQFIGELLAD